MTLLVGCGQADIAAALTGQVIATGHDQMSRVPMIFAWLLTVHGSALSEIRDEAAFEALSQADHIAATANNPWLTALVKHHLGRLALRRDNPSQAEDLHHQALDLRHAHQLRPGVVESLEALAGLAVGHQSPAEAARLFAAATPRGPFSAWCAGPQIKSDTTKTSAAFASSSTSSAFAAAWAEGCALSADEAVAYASGARAAAAPYHRLVEPHPHRDSRRRTPPSGPHQPADRRTMLHISSHREDPPHPRLQQARRHHPVATCGRSGPPRPPLAAPETPGRIVEDLGTSNIFL